MGGLKIEGPLQLGRLIAADQKQVKLHFLHPITDYFRSLGKNNRLISPGLVPVNIVKDIFRGPQSHLHFPGVKHHPM